MTIDTSPRLNVVAAVIRDDDGNVLLSQRLAGKHQGGRWEFPGGKVERGETLHQALARELHEELGIDSHDSCSFMTIDHQYPDLHVRLHFREVTRWSGVPHGREQQPVKWFASSDLSSLEFPAANKPIVTALSLPERWVILPSDYQSAWPSVLPFLMQSGVGGVYLRGAPLERERLSEMVELCNANGLKTLLRNDVAMVSAVGADGVHLSCDVAAAMSARPECGLVSVACHNQFELDHAERLGADMVMLSPVNKTTTHPHAVPLGWKTFSSWATGRPYSVYALGGVAEKEMSKVRDSGGRGIAAISAFWPS
tara:strand:- start:67451 stop:68383 length:933 start_codon:yes stop_codon:yes gene_type:complete